MNDIDSLLTLSSEDLDTAELLYKNNRYRPSISRAYYSMFYAAQALLISGGFDTSTHKGVITYRSLIFLMQMRFINFHFLALLLRININKGHYSFNLFVIHIRR